MRVQSRSCGDGIIYTPKCLKNVVRGLEGNIWGRMKRNKKLAKVCGIRVYDDSHMKANKQPFRAPAHIQVNGST
jgi:hypothetical protein